MRHVTTLGFLAPLVVAPALRGPAPDPRRTHRHPARRGNRPRPCRAGGGDRLTAAAGRHFAPAPRWMPEAALAAARAAGLTGPCSTTMPSAASHRPRRADLHRRRAELYGGPFVVETMRAMGLKDVARLDAILDGGQVQWTLLEPSTPAVAYLDRRPGWRRVFADEVAVVHAREARR